MKKLKNFLLTHLYSDTWDYDGYIKYNLRLFYNVQNDWNQTLMTKINQCSAMIFQDNNRSGANVIIIDSDMVKIFKTLNFMKEINVFHNKGYYKLGELGGRYHVYVVPKLDLDNKVFVCNLLNVDKHISNIKNYSRVAVLKIN